MSICSCEMVSPKPCPEHGPRKTAECPTCGVYMMNPAKHRDFHYWLERQLEMSQAMGSQ